MGRAARTTASSTPAQSRADGSVTARCSSSLARRVCHGETGKLRIRQRLSPSSETEGAVRQFMPAPRVAANAAAAPASPGGSSWTASSRISPALYKASTLSTTSPSDPMAQLSR